MFKPKIIVLLVCFIVLIILYGCGSIIQNSNSTTPTVTSYNTYFGDIHAHTAYSNDAWLIQKLIVGMAPVVASGAILNAIDNGLDFVAITDHAEDLSLNPLYGDEWINIQNECNAANGADIVAFIGFEFTKTSGTLDANGDQIDITGGGHKCVIFKNATIPAAPFPSSGTNLPTDLWSYLASYECITIPHHPARGDAPEGRGEYDMSTDWDYMPSNVALMPLVEIFSVHGSSDYLGCDDEVPGFRDDRSVESALQKWFTTGSAAYKLGILCSTDNHISNPGVCVTESVDAIISAEGNYSGGLVAALATAKTRDSIFDALVAKRVYGTSGPKIGLTFTATVEGDSATYIMGETIRGASGKVVRLHISASAGTTGATIQNIVLTQGISPEVGSDGITKTTINASSADLAFTITENTYFRITAYQSATQRWDPITSAWVDTNERAWSSPIWVEVN